MWVRTLSPVPALQAGLLPLPMLRSPSWEETLTFHFSDIYQVLFLLP